MTVIKPNLNPILQPDKKPTSHPRSTLTQKEKDTEEELKVLRMTRAKLTKMDYLKEKCLVYEIGLYRMRRKIIEQDTEIGELKVEMDKAKEELEVVEMDCGLRVAEEVCKKDEEIKQLKITHEAAIQKEKDTYSHHLFISHKRLDQIKSLERDKEKYIKDIEDLKCVLGERTKELEAERGETNKHRKVSHGRWGTIKSLQSKLDTRVEELERLNSKLSDQDKVLKEARGELIKFEGILNEKKGIIELQEITINSQKSEIIKSQSSTVDISSGEMEEFRKLAQERLDAMRSLEERCASQSNEIDRLKSEILTSNTASGGTKEELRRVQEISNWRYGIIITQQQMIQGQGKKIENLKMELLKRDEILEDEDEEGSCTSEAEEGMESRSEGII